MAELAGIAIAHHIPRLFGHQIGQSAPQNIFAAAAHFLD